MKQKIEYFLNAVFYINWKWLVKRQLYLTKALNYIILKVSSVISTKKFHKRVVDRQIKSTFLIEEYVNRVPNALIYPQAVLSLKSVLLLCCFSIFFPFLFIIGKYSYINQLSNQTIAIIVILFVGLPFFAYCRCEKMVTNNYLKYFEQFSKKDKAWHKKWRTIKISFFIIPLVISILYVLVASGRINF